MSRKRKWETIASGIWIGQPYGNEDWAVIVTRPDYNDGKRTYLRIGGGPDSRAVARQVATQTSGELGAAGSIITTCRGLFAEFEKGHVDTLHFTTQELYHGQIAKYLNPWFGERLITEIRKKDFFDFGVAHHSAISYTTIASILGLMRAAFGWYWDEREIDAKNPFVHLRSQLKALRKRLGAKPVRRVTPYTAEERETFLSVAADTDMLVHDIYAVAFGTGMRSGEILGLCWTDLDSERCVIQPGRAISKNGRPTSYKSEREHPILFSPSLCVLFERRRKDTRETKAGWRERVNPEWVFTSKSGTPYLKSNLYKRIKKVKLLAAEEGVPMNRRLHDARHTFASEALRATGDLEFVKNQLGHSSSRVTAGVYTHVVEDESRMVTWGPGEVK